jgi:hypothetical protein
MGRFEPTFIEAHNASKILYQVKSLKLRIKTASFLDEIITSRNEVFKGFVSEMAVEIRKLGNKTRKTAQNTNTV